MLFVSFLSLNRCKLFKEVFNLRINIILLYYIIVLLLYIIILYMILFIILYYKPFP